MRRRHDSPAAGLSTTLIALLLLFPVVSVAQQKHQAQNGVQESPREGRFPDHQFDTTNRRYKDTTVVSHNERAVATLAPVGVEPAVRAPPAKLAGPTGGLSSRLPARSLQDWEVEDFVLLATVDGSLHARDRKTGAERWSWSSDKPMVETIYHRRNSSKLGQDNDITWIVEPSQDGSIYIYAQAPSQGIQKLPLTVKQLVEDLSPYSGEDPPVVYTGEKRNTMFTIDSRNGNILQMFSPGSTQSVDMGNCKPESPIGGLDDDECEPIDKIVLGRSEYVVSIHDSQTAELICTLKYAEWGPNNRDRDLHSQYVNTMDNQYVYSRFDGSIFAIEHLKGAKNGWNSLRKFTKKLSSPVARVFDLARPFDTNAQGASLVVLPQPTGPAQTASAVYENVFINCTEAGSWYAMSEANYPSVTDGALKARCYSDQLPELQYHQSDQSLDFSKSTLVGVHSLSQQVRSRHTLPLITAPEDFLEIDPSNETLPHHQSTIGPPNQARLFLGPWSFSSMAGLLTLLAVVAAISSKYSHLLPSWRDSTLSPEPTHAVNVTHELSALPESGESVPPAVELAAIPQETKLEEAPAIESAAETTAEKHVSFIDTVTNDNELVRVATDDTAIIAGLPDTEGNSISEPVVGAAGDAVEATPSETPKKKAHRGTRGGRNRKKKKSDNKPDAQKEEQDPVHLIINGVKNMGQMQSLQADEISVDSSGVTDVSDTLQIHNLTIKTDKVLGHGSGGTFVFEGAFGGRVVAVKRMLLQYTELAMQEVELLQQSDDHPNVIRYFSQEKDQHFLYIAVEKCQASLFDLFKDGRRDEDWDDSLQSLVIEIQRDIPKALKQLAAGLNHLHSLRIIHRDIKPQNILIAYPKKTFDGPRFVISDFGLCKTLPENMSTLVGTTVSAGTVGWKAPELILQPKDATEGRLSSTHSRESSSSGDNVSGHGGVKRAADIFSLGCVFFYVLTDGCHPFDDDEGWMQIRELNIKKNKCNMSKLQGLGDDAEEPIHLISWMLENKPEDRPTAAQVLQHPFFWKSDKRLAFLCDVSDHWEREPRDPPSEYLEILEYYGSETFGHDFLAALDRKFIDTLGKQRKYTGSRMLDLLRALRNKKNHYDDMPPDVQARVGPLPQGYLRYWTSRFPKLLMSCYKAVLDCQLQDEPRFKPYFAPPDAS